MSGTTPHLIGQSAFSTGQVPPTHGHTQAYPGPHGSRLPVTGRPLSPNVRIVGLSRDPVRGELVLGINGYMYRQDDGTETPA